MIKPTILIRKNSKFSKKWPKISMIQPETSKNVLKIPTQATSDPNLGWFLSKRTILDFFQFSSKNPQKFKISKYSEKWEILEITHEILKLNIYEMPKNRPFWSKLKNVERKILENVIWCSKNVLNLEKMKISGIEETWFILKWSFLGKNSHFWIQN